MVFEYEIKPFLDWLLSVRPDSMGALWLFVLTVFVLTLGGAFFGYLVAALRVGPGEAFFVVAKVIATAIPDLVRISPRRTGAMAWLAIKEAVRNKVLVVFGVFAVILLIGSWFLDSKSDHPATLYLSVVLTMTNYLTLLLGLFLSALSIPNDIKNRTIYTVVTKPVRAGEIVLGRIIGFGAIGTAILAVMYVVSFLFVYFGLQHAHEIDAKDLAEVTQAERKPGDKRPAETQDANAPKPKRGLSTNNRHHRHTVTVMPDGQAFTDSQMDHRHPVRKVGEGADARYVLDGPTDNLPARIPLTATTLRFYDRTGRPSDKGINVGNEWMYRSYVEGGTAAAAVWSFEGVTPEKFPEGLPLELTIRVFRTYKGTIVDRVTGQIVIKNPVSGTQSAPIIFESQEYSVQQIKIPRKVKQDGRDREIDLFADLIDNGKVEVWLSCNEPSQYFGMARADVYLRQADGHFWLNLLKGYYSIWLQMVLVISFGVMFSTFLSGAVAIMSTVSTLMVGFFSRFIIELFQSIIDKRDETAMGGGPIEALVRLVTQKNLSIELDLPWLALKIIEGIDFALMAVMWVAAQVLPNFGRFDTSEFVATGYDVFGGLLVQQSLAAAGYVLVLAVLGYFFLRTREIAA